MTEQVAFHTVKRFVEMLAPGGNMEIVFFGGEPLLNWPLAKKVITFCETELKSKYADRNWIYHLTTNLTLFPNDLLDWVKRYNITFLVDVDGPERIHNTMRPARSGNVNSYRRTVKNIERLVAAGIQPALRTTVTTHNVQFIPEIARLHKELGGRGTAFVTITPVNSDELILPMEWYPDPHRFVEGLVEVVESRIWEIEDVFPFNQLAKQVRPGGAMRVACGAPFGNTPTVDANGDVYACIYLVGIKRYHIGNVFDADYPQKDVLEKMAHLVDVENLEFCMECAYRFMCVGGCPVTRYTLDGNPRANTEAIRYAGAKTCIVHKSIIDYILWKLAEDATQQIVTGTAKRASSFV